LRNQPMKTIIIAAMSAILATAAVEAQSPTQKRERAVAVLKSLETGDAKAWEQHVSAEKYIQQNLAFPNGREVVMGALPKLKEAGTKVNTRRVLADGDQLGRLHDWQQETILKLRWSADYEDHCHRSHRHDWLTNRR
jgi:hypothetical protein